MWKENITSWNGAFTLWLGDIYTERIDTKISTLDRYQDIYTVYGIDMAVFNADMQGEGRGSFLCLLGVCLIAIAAAAAALDPWSPGSQIITDQE